ncbi:S1C family serine protease [Qipengyuania sp.]|uniref:S1C family serine protease n=1 Tax=Qipengyuania sp. TaxID=2004515 RepID=UPI0035C80E72
MTRILIALLLFVTGAPALADAGDIDAAARGVVRVVIVGKDDEGVYPVSHGSGFAITPTRIVTNAHVVRDAEQDDELRIAIVPPEGGSVAYGHVLATSSRNDLALIAIDGDLRLPPLALAGGPPQDSGQASAVGYPMNVDKAQGLSIDDIFTAQPPVKSRGFLSGFRPSREFDTVLHTAPIARGNSGGPLLDACGRVLGVNSFGAESDGTDGEFYFAVSIRELLPFLRAHDVTPRVNSSPCRSLADLDAAERQRLSQEQAAARAAMSERAEDLRVRQDRARFEAEMRVRDERDDRMLASVLLLLIAAGLGWWAYEKRERHDGQGERLPFPRENRAAAVGAGAALIGALFLQVTRPGIDEIDRRTAAALGTDAPDTAANPAPLGSEGARRLVCRLDQQRSRVTTSRTEDIPLEWTAAGCVNGRTQYGFSDGTWSRVLVPNDDQEVSVNSFDPDRREFRTERYLLSRNAMQAARGARGAYKAPACGADNAAAGLGDQQRAVLATLPPKPNERLVYTCETTGK